jgi:uncharacterized protein YxjI
MPIPITCSVCGAAYTLRDEYAGRRVKCPKCQNVLDLPEPPAEAVVVVEEEVVAEDGFPDHVPEAFRRHKFLLRQKFWAIKEKYRVADEEGEPILYVERPAHLTRGCLALMAGIPIILVGIIAAVVMVEDARGDQASAAAGIAVGVVAFLLGLALIVALYPRRHVQFFADESKTDLLLEVKQESKFGLVNFWYTLTDADGQVLARFRKNHLHSILRKRWFIHGPDGETLFVVKEDSIILSLLRRTVGAVFDEIPLVGVALAAVLRTNFVFTRAGELEVIGEFNRRLTVLDRYVLDLTDDEGRVLDRRVAVAIGVLLDTGERR